MRPLGEPSSPSLLSSSTQRFSHRSSYFPLYIYALTLSQWTSRLSLAFWQRKHGGRRGERKVCCTLLVWLLKPKQLVGKKLECCFRKKKRNKKQKDNDGGEKGGRGEVHPADADHRAPLVFSPEG